MKENAKDRLLQFLDYKGIGQNKFEKAVGLSIGYINKLRHEPSPTKLRLIINTYPELDENWLLTGEGDMLKSDTPTSTGTTDDTSSQALPLLPVNAMAGALSGQADPVMLYDCEQYVVPIFHGADFLIRVEGDSMMPTYMPGDLVACQRVPLSNLWFQWGKAYVIDSRQGALIKRIEPSGHEGSVLICSDNDNYKPFELPVSEINGVALVRGMVRVG